MYSPMLVSRILFACYVVDGKIVIAGGFNSELKSATKAEMYDPEMDIWISLPDIHHSHDPNCTGLMIGGKMHIVYRECPQCKFLTVWN